MNRRLEDERLNEINRTCHVLQDSNARMLDEYHKLNTRVSIVEERIVSREKETNSKLEVMHNEIINASRMLESHTKMEDQDRQEIIKQQRANLRWVIGLVVMFGIAILTFVLNTISFHAVNG